MAWKSSAASTETDRGTERIVGKPKACIILDEDITDLKLT